MLNKPWGAIDRKEIETLVHNSVAEGKSIEYKLILPGNTDKDKKEFLADVSSFANTIGGDLFFGIKEENGVAASIEGISVLNVDEEIRKYDNLIRDGIEPRVQATIHAVPIQNGKIVIIIRINKSWIGPHRVIFQSHDKFYARNSGGKYALDTIELRTAFSLSDTLVDKIKHFRTERIAALMADNTPIPFYAGGKIILHLIPLEAFSPNARIDIRPLINSPEKLRPIYCSEHTDRINLEGMLTYSGGKENSSHSYVQLFRNGIIEAVEGLLLSSVREQERGDKYIPSAAYEKELLKSLPLFLKALRVIKVNLPIFAFLTLTGIKGFKMAGNFSEDISSYSIDRDILILPEFLIESYDTDSKDILKPMFDLIWNACGFQGSLNFDNGGNWINR